MLKNMTEDNDGTVNRKVREIFRALEFEKNYTKEEMHAMGVNDSALHVDFMIGTEDLSIVGVRKDGSEFVIFENGLWAF